MYTLEWRALAEKDLEQIVDYIAADNPKRALSFVAELRDKGRLLLANPRMGRIGRVKSTRELVAHPNYIIVYRLAGQVIEVLRVKHVAQRWP